MTFKHNLITFQNLTDVTTNKGRYYVTPDGKKYPSVTTALKHLSADSIAAWRKRVGEEEADRISERARTRGTALHAAMEACLLNQPVEPIIAGKPIAILYHKIRKILDSADIVVRAVEAPLYSHILKVAGRTDDILEWNGHLSILDFKTSEKHKLEDWVLGYFLQMTCYSLMLEEMTGLKAKKLLLIIVNDVDDMPQVFMRDRKDYFEPLMNALKTFRREHAPSLGFYQ